jgi:cbb3-type cytochrome oxidase subunit 3
MTDIAKCFILFFAIVYIVITFYCMIVFIHKRLQRMNIRQRRSGFKLLKGEIDE